LKTKDSALLSVFRSLIAGNVCTALNSSFESLFESGIVGFEEGFKGHAHVLVFVLLAKFVAQLLNTVVFESAVELLLLLLRNSQHRVRVNFFGLLPEILSSLNDLLSDHKDGLVVLHHAHSFKCIVNWLHQNHLLRKFFNLEIFDLSLSFLAICL